MIILVVSITFLQLLKPVGSSNNPLTCIYIDYAEKDDTFINSQVENRICNKTFQVSYINTPPHNLPSDDGPALVESILRRCCGRNVDFAVKTLNNMSEVTLSSLEDAHFVYPLLGPSSAMKVHGFHYLPYDQVSRVIYITKNHTQSLFISILSVYPLVIVCISLAIVSGFVAWILETWSNKEEFPRAFLVGWFEGFWWSWISMTTVGYGDKTPRTVAARLYSVVWILVGIVAFGLLTGEMTGHIVKANSPPPAEMKGKNVGVLRYRDFDAYVVSTHGGKIVRNDEIPEVIDFQSDVLQLIRKLQEGLINGFVLDPWTLEYATSMLLETENGKIQIGVTDFFFHQTTRVEKSNKGKELSYGILVRNEEDYNYFKDYVEGNQIAWSIVDSQDWIQMKKEVVQDGYGEFYSSGSGFLFKADGKYFQYSMIAIAAMLGVIFIIGMFYELKRQSYICAKYGVSSSAA